MLTRHSTELTDPEVVPSLAHRWSHPTGGTHLKSGPMPLAGDTSHP